MVSIYWGHGLTVRARCKGEWGRCSESSSSAGGGTSTTSGDGGGGGA